MRWALKALGGVGAVVAVGLGLVYQFQEKLLYLPRIPGVPNEFAYLPDRFGLEYEDVYITAKDGTKLHSWMMWPKGWSKQKRHSRPTVLFFQENAGNMSFRLPFLRLVAHHLHCQVFAPSYRGYGLSQGKPNEPGLQMDAQAALEYLTTDSAVNKDNIVIFGRSLGGAVAFWVAAANPGFVNSLIVENTFWSIEAVVGKVMPFLAPFVGPGRLFNFLIRNRWYNEKAIAKLGQLPVCLLSSLQDEMLPPEHMERMHKMLLAQQGRVTWVPLQAGHMDAYETAAQDYWPAVAKFTQHYAHSLETDPEDDQSNAGVQEAVQATNAGVMPPSAVGPFTDGSSRPSQVHDEQDAGAALQAPGSEALHFPLMVWVGKCQNCMVKMRWHDSAQAL
ncbi:hypothetical protein WJX82_005301 [Trebouxia sp. C0006]